MRRKGSRRHAEDAALSQLGPAARRMSRPGAGACCAAVCLLALLEVRAMSAEPSTAVGSDVPERPYDLAFGDPAQLPAVPTDAAGFPSRAADLDILPGFRRPPPGYGEVPFWWWTGDPLDRERLLWQIEELHAKGVSGMQVNYAHDDTPGWPTYAAEPEVFSDAWWDTWGWVVAECRKRGMGIGLSGYTLDWPGKATNLFGRLLYGDPETQGLELTVVQRQRVDPGMPVALEVPTDAIMVRAYPLDGETPRRGGTDLAAAVHAGRLTWTPPPGTWEVWIVSAQRKPLTLNPLHPESGARVVTRFFQPCQDRTPGGSAAGLNYFFQDELQFGVAGRLWCADFAAQFRRRQGYDLLDVLPALFTEMGPLTPKARLDYAEVKAQLMEERYFRPIFDWHWSRGLIYACDPGSRGRNPEEFGDYFRCVRWYTAPGHDTPGGSADLIKGKVSSSIAHLYQRPRVWLEGYHSLGWGATPARLLQATCENYVYGCNLLNLHGLYYTTHGGFWEWAPPCYHVRMPYWEHMGVFLKYVERLSYVLSQGVHCCEVAVVYPVAPYDAGMGGPEAAACAFAAGQALVGGGLDVDFVDVQSLARAECRDGRLHVAGESYSVLILPALRAVRWATLEKARELYRAGGTVLGLEALPEASERAGAEDPELEALVRELFGSTAAEAKTGARPPPQRSPAGGRGAALLSLDEPPPRHYEGGFAGRWVWAREAVSDVRFKGIWRAPTTAAETCPIRFFCDNAGALYINERRLCERADYQTGWSGEAVLRDGDVITVDAHDDDRGDHSAGVFLAILRAGQTVFSALDLRYAPGREADAGWRLSPDLTGLALPDPANVHELHRGRATGSAEALLAALRHVPREVTAEAPCLALHRRAGPREVYLVTGAARGAECVFRSRGRAELWDPWTGAVQALLVTAETAEGTRVRLPLGQDEAQLIVFSPEAVPARVTDTSLAEVAEIRTAGDLVTVTGYAAQAGPQTATVQWEGREVRATGNAPELPPPPDLGGPWEFELAPTLDNRWGDFRMPPTTGRIGPEARLYRYAAETAADPGWQKPEFDDSAWPRVTYGYGQHFWKLGPLPADADASALDARLADMAQIDASVPLQVGGTSYVWQPYAFSWRWGVEGDPGHQGWHGLKESISDDFICLGAPKDGHNETLYVAEPAGTRYYLWTTTPAPAAIEAALHVGGLLPAAVYSNGRRVERTDAPLRLRPGANPLLLRYDTPGRGHVVLERLGAGTPGPRTPLAMRWYDLPGRLAFDVRPGEAAPTGWYRFRAPPGLAGMTVTARGTLQAWAEGQPLQAAIQERHPDGTLTYGVALTAPLPGLARIALRLEQERGCYGGAALPEPIRLDCRAGLLNAGDWSQDSALECYSGGAWYRRTVTLTAAHLGGRVLLDLGAVAATAEVRVNGSPAGVRVAPPWVVDIGALAKAGDNRIEVGVYNTLANHYRTIPTRYRGSPQSGLLGPVRLEVRPRVELSGVLPSAKGAQ